MTVILNLIFNKRGDTTDIKGLNLYLLQNPDNTAAILHSTCVHFPEYFWKPIPDYNLPIDFD
jgi:hypothetical protein